MRRTSDYYQCEGATELRPLGTTLKGGIMKEKIQNWLHDLGVALGLIEPPLQPVPIRTDDEQRRRQQRRR
ncbi:hypothetical protein ACVK1X_005144 [Pseudomonas sp. PvR086]|nr:hypothetical protein PMI21_05735 [Pseudomonas sp. GM18]NMN79189.1 hypothetical protein [Pseudomonas sp. KD5]PZW59686.1 hypothetical protein F475_03636 [Pseudomonas sp. URMO17WK12:I6]CAH0182822.1 hypothetical protein SRABI130_01558 [Pseudomonas sp. Bi130]CAH0288885.1 hypothetical protein SRABI123_04161 [Pseudomonas sp. Bi123]GID06815.1 hypothetical protein TMM008_40170 [Pseudomonas sp. 008]